MSAPPISATVAPVAGTSSQALVRMASGLLVMFGAFGFGSWFSGAASWVAFYLGARGSTLTAVAQASVVAGVVAAVIAQLAWYRRRCLRGRVDIPAAAVWAACLALPLGNICWAIFVDAVAWHYGRDVVRPAFDYAIMYVVLGGIVPLTLGVPWLVSGLARGAPKT